MLLATTETKALKPGLSFFFTAAPWGCCELISFGPDRFIRETLLFHDFTIAQKV
jgi:hypothetical protein